MADVLEFARDIGVRLLPWQQVLLDRSLRLTDGRWTHRTVLAITARQSGKTTLSAVRALAELCLWGGSLVITCAQSRDVALHSFRFMVQLAEEAGLPIVKVRRAVGSEELVLDPDGREVALKVVSSTSDGARGLSPDLVICDELASMRTTEPFGALEKARRARPSSQAWCISSEGTDESVVLDRLKRQGREAAETGAVSPLGYYEWSAREDREPDDREGWQESNPALGHLIDEATIAAELALDDPANFEREVLGRRSRVTRTWLRPGTWEACADASATVPDHATGLVFAIDARPDLQHASIVVAWLRADRRVHVEAVAAYDGPDASAQAENRLHALVERWQPRALAVMAKGPAEPVAGRVAAATDTALTTVGTADMGRATRSFYDAVASRRVVHPPDPVLAAHLAAAEQDEPGLFALRKRNPVVDIDAAVAGVLAVWVLDRAPVAPKLTWVAV